MMTHFSSLLLTLILPAVIVDAFSVVAPLAYRQSQSSGDEPCLHASQQKTTSTSWSDYKKSYVDPLTPHQVESEVHTHVDSQKRALADEYWLRLVEKEKKRLHDHMVDTATTTTRGTPEDDNSGEPMETYSHYKQHYIDPITPHKKASPVMSHLDPRRRENADKFWRAVYWEEKEKVRRSHHEAYKNKDEDENDDGSMNRSTVMP